MSMYMLYAVVYSLFGFKHNAYIFSLGEPFIGDNMSKNKPIVDRFNTYTGGKNHA
jgi:hypothetical protein